MVIGVHPLCFSAASNHKSPVRLFDWTLDFIGFQVKEMVALRPPFRAEDMEGLYRILNTIKSRIVLDSTRLFPTLQYENISAGH